MLEHKFTKKSKTLELTTDAAFKYCTQVSDLLVDNGYEVIEVRRIDCGAAHKIFVVCTETDIEKIVEYCKMAFEV